MAKIAVDLHYPISPQNSMVLLEVQEIGIPLYTRLTSSPFFPIHVSIDRKATMYSWPRLLTAVFFPKLYFISLDGLRERRTVRRGNINRSRSSCRKMLISQWHKLVGKKYGLARGSSISFPESSLPLSSCGAANKDLWGEAIHHDRIRGLPVLLRMCSTPCFN